MSEPGRFAFELPLDDPRLPAICELLTGRRFIPEIGKHRQPDEDDPDPPQERGASPRASGRTMPPLPDPPRRASKPRILKQLLDGLPEIGDECISSEWPANRRTTVRQVVDEDPRFEWINNGAGRFSIVRRVS